MSIVILAAIHASPTPCPEAFDSEECIFRLKMDGFRAMAHVGEIEPGWSPRRGNAYKGFLDVCAAIHIDLNLRV